MKQRLIKDLILYMNVEQLEKKYNLHLGEYLLDWDLVSFYSERASYRALPTKFWTKVSEDPELTFNFIDLYKDFLQWDVIDYYKWRNDIRFAREFAERIDWWKYGEFFVANNTEDVIREFIDYLDFTRTYFKWKDPSLNFIREINDKVKWFDTDRVIINAADGLKRTEITDEYAKELFYILNEETVSQYTNIWCNIKLSKKIYNRIKKPYILRTLIWNDVLAEDALEEVVERYKTNKDLLVNIINRCTISEDFINKISVICDEQNLWKDISIHQLLTEEFMEKYANKLNWANLVQYQKMSEDFIEKHLNYIKGFFDKLLSSKNLTERFLNKYFHLLSPVSVARYQYLSDEFIEEHFKDNYLKDLAKRKRSRI